MDLIELKARCHKAITYGRKIANAEAYVAALEAEVGSVAMAGITKYSPNHILALITKVEQVRSGEGRRSEVSVTVSEEPVSVTVSEEPKEPKKRSKKKKDDSSVDNA